MSELNDNIEKRLLAQKILDADSILEALEYIKGRYNLNLKLEQKNGYIPKPVIFEFFYSRENFQIDKLRHGWPYGNGTGTDIFLHHLRNRYTQTIESCNLIKVDLFNNINSNFIEGSLVFDIPQMMEFDQKNHGLDLKRIQ